MIRTLLIANRGEIARRVMRTAKRMGIATVAVYSEADANAPHVREADRAILIGPAPSRESYLNQKAILAAAKDAEADAVHPGYGFLSENAEFAEAVAKDGLIWVGPPPAAIRAMGLKDAAKKLMDKAGVPTTPGYLGDDQAEKSLAAQAAKIGFPVLIKAVAGGGGKGMRKVDEASAFADALGSARREAKAAFGDDRVLLEKYVTNPRHIEVQVFGDAHGNFVHLFERDCSLQRRHQKVIEEAPAPGMDDLTRARVCDAALKAARAVGYVGAGTVEFIADASAGLNPDRIWFMEMNTRLQVEHPVTEAITGLDLVEWQLRVASGEKLPLAQARIKRDGHAIEARLYAENPHSGFLPSTGRLTHMRLPETTVRVDSGVEEGGEVSPFYDPMIAKLVAHAPSREEAILKLARACRAIEVWPVKTNAAFLARALDDDDFRAARIDTGFIEERIERLAEWEDPSNHVLNAATTVMLRRRAKSRDGKSPWQNAAGFRLNAPAAETEVRLQSGDAIYTVDTVADAQDDSRAPVAHGFGRHIVVFEGGEAYDFTAPGAGEAAGELLGDGAITAPMPGQVIAVAVSRGDHVKKRQPLVVLEAMKMEHTLTAPFDGTVEDVRVKAGDRVSEGVVMMKLKN
jgi:acetyl/propionyl-CoA carboxylase alpha subunit